MSKYLEAVVENFEDAIKFKKCWKCGCHQNTVKALEQQLSQLNEDDKRDIAPLLERSKATFEPVQYDCLGCKICYPAVITNELSKAYPGLPLEEEGCGPTVTDENERKGWPPLAGNYEVLRYQASVAVCTLNSKNLLQEVALEGHTAISIVGTLNTENLGIERIIQNVATNPNIRFLILCGEDSEQKIGHLPGQSLVSLFEKGVDEKRRIIGAPGKRPVLKNIEPSLIDHFRNQVQLVNMIGCKLSTSVIQMADHCSKTNAAPYTKPLSALQISIPKIQAKESRSLILDPNGYLVIFPDRVKENIVVEHYRNDGTLSQIVEGSDIGNIYTTVIELGLVSKLDHACYFGKELARAEMSLRTGTSYQQDKAQGQSFADGESSCKSVGCC